MHAVDGRVMQSRNDLHETVEVLEVTAFVGYLDELRHNFATLCKVLLSTYTKTNEKLSKN